MHIICPRCGAIAEYNAYYGRYTCTRCNWEEKPENMGRNTDGDCNVDSWLIKAVRAYRDNCDEECCGDAETGVPACAYYMTPDDDRPGPGVCLLNALDVAMCCGKSQCTRRANALDFGLYDRLLDAFPEGYISRDGDFIPHSHGGYFLLRSCNSELDVQCQILQWLSLDAFKTQPYIYESLNKRFHSYMLRGINDFLGTQFTEDDMEIIYKYLGAVCNHERTVQFIQDAHFDMKFFEQFARRDNQ